MIKILFYSILALFTVISCNKESNLDCSNAFPPPNSFKINIVDSVGNSYFNESEDSIRLYNNFTEQYVKTTPFAVPNHFQVFFPKIESGVEYLIDLQDTNIHSVQFYFATQIEDCFTSYTMNSILFNEQEILTPNLEVEVFKLIK